MRALFLFLLLVAGAGAGIYYTNDKARETVRGWQVSDEDRERFDAYERGKALFKATWEGAPNARFLAWGDDPSETAGPVKADKVTGDVWIARGHVTVDKGGSKEQQQWCLAFDRAKGTTIGRAVGKEAEETLRKIDSGELQKTVVQTVAKATPKPTPSGAWMFEKGGTLDKPAKKAGK